MMDNDYARQVREAYPHLDALIDLDVPDHLLQDYTDGVLNPEHLARLLGSKPLIGQGKQSLDDLTVADFDQVSKDMREYEHDRRLRNQFE